MAWLQRLQRKKKGAHPHTDTRPANAHAPVYHTPCLGCSRGQEAGGSGRDPSRSHVSHERLVLEAGYRVICIATLPCLKGDDGLYLGSLSVHVSIVVQKRAPSCHAEAALSMVCSAVIPAVAGPCN
jgi:hypothetical protein